MLAWDPISHSLRTFQCPNLQTMEKFAKFLRAIICRDRRRQKPFVPITATSRPAALHLPSHPAVSHGCHGSGLGWSSHILETVCLTNARHMEFCIVLIPVHVNMSFRNTLLADVPRGCRAWPGTSVACLCGLNMCRLPSHPAPAKLAKTGF